MRSGTTKNSRVNVKAGAKHPRVAGAEERRKPARATGRNSILREGVKTAYGASAELRKRAYVKTSPSKDKKGPAAGQNKKNKGPRPPLRTAISPRIVILMILFGIFITFSIGPVMRNMDATAKLKEKEKELAAETRTTEALSAEVAEARSLEHIEKEARSQHMAAPDETVYIITSEESGEDPEVKVKSPQSMDEAWERVQRLLGCSHERPGKAD